MLSYHLLDHVIYIHVLTDNHQEECSKTHICYV